MAVTYPAATPAEPVTGERPYMLHVSIIVEALRSRPELMFAFAALAQGALWTIVPSLFFAAPPGELPLVLAVGREWMTGSPYGPPLAFWLGEFVFEHFGLAGVYLLSQLCVVATYCIVFALGRRIVGAAHAAMAVLLMTGIGVFTLPSVAFGPSVLAMPLAALSLLFAYRALAANRRADWLGLGVAIGLLMLAATVGVVLALLIVAFMAASPRVRARLGAIEPWAAAAIAVLINFPQFIWLERSGLNPLPALAALPGAIFAGKRLVTWLDVVLWLAVSHAGLVILAFVAGRLSGGARAGAPVFERAPVDPQGRTFVYVFALVPPLVATLLLVLFGWPLTAGGAAPLVLLSGLAVVIAAADTIRLYRERIAALVWLGLLVAPPILVVASLVTLPWTGRADLQISKPATAMGQFFTETFRRRTGRPLAIVVGDARTGGLVALASPDRPSLYIDAAPERAPWMSDEALRRNGAVVVWTATDAAGTPPANLKARFPDMVPEVPRSFDYAVQGRLPLLRIGWAVLRPS